MAIDPQPWDRQKQDGKLEPALWFDRFRRYLLLGPTRSLMHVYREYRRAKGHPNPSGLRVPAGSWQKAYTKWRWKERAEAYDTHLRDLEIAAAEQGRVEAALKLGKAAPDAAQVLVDDLEQKSPTYRQRAATSILDRSSKTAPRQIQELPDEVARLLETIGVILYRFIPEEKQEEFEKALADLLK